MNPVLEDFSLDLERLKKILTLAESAGGLRGLVLDPESIGQPDLRQAIVSLQAASQDSHPEMPILNGVLLLYLAGRFEHFARELFEDLADAYATSAGEFSRLPRAMKESLIKFTAEVIGNHRKYRHGDKGVASFVRILSDNLNGQPLARVNSQCMSITSENMKPEILAELFGRIGMTDIWKKIGQQAPMQQFFEVDQPEKATSESSGFLAKFMDLRNQIAHPSGTIIWPRIDETLRHIDYCEVLGRVLSDLCSASAVSYGKKLASETSKDEVSEDT